MVGEGDLLKSGENEELKRWRRNMLSKLKYRWSRKTKPTSMEGKKEKLINITNLSSGWFYLATAKICCSWWKLRFCNRCHLLPCNTIFLKKFVLIILVCKHSDFQFERKQIFFQYVKKIPKNRVKPYFSEWFLIIEKKFVCAQIRNLSINPNNKHKIF